MRAQVDRAPLRYHADQLLDPAVLCTCTRMPSAACAWILRSLASALVDRAQAGAPPVQGAARRADHAAAAFEGSGAQVRHAK